MNDTGKTVNFAIVGCGMVLEHMFGPVLRLVEGGRCVALMDTDADRLERAKGVFDVDETYSDYGELLKQKHIDAVLIGSPVFAHKEQTVQAAEAGKHVLCEKPLARDIDECDEMIRACELSGVVFMTGLMKRFNTCFKMVKEMIEDGTLGEVYQIRVIWDAYDAPGTSSGWRRSLQTLGGVFQDHGSHTIDLCRWWVGDVESVRAQVWIQDARHSVEDSTVALLRHKGGCVSIHEMTFASHRQQIEQYEIYGTGGFLRVVQTPTWSFNQIEPFRMTLYEEGGVKATDISPNYPWNLDEKLRAHFQYLLELNHFLECIRQGRRPIVTGQLGRDALEVINAAYLSSHTGETVGLPLQGAPPLRDIFSAMKENGLT